MSYALADSTETDESNEWLVFEVTDTGCGISQRGLASLFTEYVQVGSALARAGPNWQIYVVES